MALNVGQFLFQMVDAVQFSFFSNISGGYKTIHLIFPNSASLLEKERIKMVSSIIIHGVVYKMGY